MTGVAVVVHAGKLLGGGVDELRECLADAGVGNPLWYEVRKAKKAAKRVRQAMEAGADLVFVWGGDGTVQRAVDVVANTETAIAVLPAGTANIFASNLGIPRDIRAAVDIGLHGARRRLDVGRINGERFAVMAGAGFDARMIHDADRGLKDRVGRLAYVFSGAKNLRAAAVCATITVDGEEWFDDKASCVLFANVGKLFGGLEPFANACPDSGRLELGVVTAEGVWQWMRTLASTLSGRPQRSPFVQMTSGERFTVHFSRPTVYELDGGDRKKTTELTVAVEPAALTVCVPETSVP